MTRSQDLEFGDTSKGREEKRDAGIRNTRKDGEAKSLIFEARCGG